MKIAVIGLLISVLVAGYHGQPKHAQSAEIQKTGEHAPPKSGPAFIPARNTPADQKQSASKEALNYLKGAFGPEYLAAWALVVAASIGLYVTWLTAKAAFLNAQALVNAGRAWVIVEKPEDGAIKMVEFGHQQTSITVNIRYSNEGRSPCWITEKRVHFAIVEKLPKEPAFDKHSVELGRPESEALTVGQKSTLPIRNLLCEGVHVMTLGASSTEDKETPRGNVPVLYGVIKYRDVFGLRGETSFGYQIKGSGRVDYIHSEKYNRNT